MAQYLSAVTDLSLVSDVSDLDIPVSSNNSVHADLLSDILRSHDPSLEPRSPLPSETSDITSTKQVRFNEAVTVSTTMDHSKSFSHSTGQDEFEETEDITVVTPLRGAPEQDENHTSKTYSSGTYSHPTVLTNTGDSCTPLEHNGPPSGNTSIWLETASESLSKKAATAMPVKDSPPLSIDTDQGLSFFRTSDHLPRPPPHYNSSNSSRPTPFSSSDPSNIPSSSHALFVTAPPIPRALRTPSPSSPSLSLSSLVTDTLTETSDDGVVDLSKPKANTTRSLADQIQRLTQELSAHSLNVPNEKARKEAEHLVNEATGFSNVHNQVDTYVPNPGLTVNIPEHVCTYTNLMDLSVDESEIVRQERERVAEQRRRMAHIRKQEAKKKPQIPKPDLLEFFDPNRHIFQSVNLHVKSLPSFLPIITTASSDLVNVFHDQIMTDFCRLHM